MRTSRQAAGSIPAAALTPAELAALDELRARAEGMTYEAIGQRLGLSRERIRQIEAGALVKLRRIAKVQELGPPRTTAEQIDTAIARAHDWRPAPVDPRIAEIDRALARALSGGATGGAR